MKQLNFYEAIETASATQDITREVSDSGSFSGNAAHCLNSNLAHAKTEATDAPEQAQANVTEIIIAREKADSVQMILPMLNHLNQEERWLAWIDPPMELLKKWKDQTPLQTSEIMIIRSDEKSDALSLTKKALKAGTCHAVIVWTEQLSNRDFEELELASAQGNSHGIALRYR